MSRLSLLAVIVVASAAAIHVGAVGLHMRLVKERLLTTVLSDFTGAAFLITACAVGRTPAPKRAVKKIGLGPLVLALGLAPFAKRKEIADELDVYPITHSRILEARVEHEDRIPESTKQLTVEPKGLA